MVAASLALAHVHVAAAPGGMMFREHAHINSRGATSKLATQRHAFSFKHVLQPCPKIAPNPAPIARVF